MSLRTIYFKQGCGVAVDTDAERDSREGAGCTAGLF